MLSVCRVCIGWCWRQCRGNNDADDPSRGTLIAKVTLRGYILVPAKDLQEVRRELIDHRRFRASLKT